MLQVYEFHQDAAVPSTYSVIIGVEIFRGNKNEATQQQLVGTCFNRTCRIGKVLMIQFGPNWEAKFNPRSEVVWKSGNK